MSKVELWLDVLAQARKAYDHLCKAGEIARKWEDTLPGAADALGKVAGDLDDAIELILGGNKT